jgi:hypothetical protein
MPPAAASDVRENSLQDSGTALAPLRDPYGWGELGGNTLRPPRMNTD